jgi:hypothetical protein
LYVFEVQLYELCFNSAWRANAVDSFGSSVVHAAISLMMEGPHYNNNKLIEVTLEIVGFAFYVVFL